jgi:hypothetical protein
MSVSNFTEVFTQKNATLDKLIQFKLTDGVDKGIASILPVYCDKQNVKLYNRNIIKTVPISKIFRAILNIKKIHVTEQIRIDETGYHCKISAPTDRNNEFDFHETYTCVQDGNDLIGTFTTTIINNLNPISSSYIEKTYIDERYKKLKEELLAASNDYIPGPKVDSPPDSPPDSPIKLEKINIKSSLKSAPDNTIDDGYNYDDMIIQ